MKLQPGEPLPADLPPDAQRLRRVEDDVAGGRTPIAAIVEMPALAPRAKSWIVGLGAAGVAVGAAMTAFLTFLGIPLVFVSLIALYHGLVPGTKTVVTPSPRGGYLAFEADPDEARREEPFRIEFFLFVVTIFVMSRLIEHFAYRGSWVGIAPTSIVGCALLYFGSRRDDEWDASELAASLRFRALADPTRPLTDLQRVGRDPIAAEAPVRRPEP